MNHVIKPHPKFLWFLILSYTMIISISNWFDSRLIEIFGVITSPGTLVFPITFLISDLITEVYGYKNARIAIWAAFLFNVLFLCYGQLIIHLPSPAYAIDNEAIDKVLSMNVLIIAASFLSYLISEPINSYIVSKLKVKYQGKYLGYRFLLSTIIASFLDSFIFGIVAFSTIYPIKNVLTLSMNIWIIKVVIELIGLPISIRLAKLLKEKESLDIYDINTNYNIFKLDTEYSEITNKKS